MKGQTSCQCGCSFDLKQPIIFLAASIERELGYELFVTSGARCDEHTATVTKNKNSAHTLGLALDVSTPTSADKYALLKALFARGVKRIFINEKKDFIHFDVAVGALLFPTETLKEYPQNVVGKY